MNVVDVYGQTFDDLEGFDQAVGGPAFDVESAVAVEVSGSFSSRFQFRRILVLLTKPQGPRHQ